MLRKYYLFFTVLLIGLLGAGDSAHAQTPSAIVIRFFESTDIYLQGERFGLLAFSGEAGQNITLIVHGLQEDVSPDMVILNPDGSLLSEDTSPTNDNTAFLQVEIAQTGQYHILLGRHDTRPGLLRVMLFEGEPFQENTAIQDYADPRLPSRAYLIAGDSHNPLDVALDVDASAALFASRGNNYAPPPREERLTPVQHATWINDDGELLYTLNVRPIPEWEMLPTDFTPEQLTPFTFVIEIGQASAPPAVIERPIEDNIPATPPTAPYSGVESLPPDASHLEIDIREGQIFTDTPDDGAPEEADPPPATSEPPTDGQPENPRQDSNSSNGNGQGGRPSDSANPPENQGNNPANGQGGQSGNSSENPGNERGNPPAAPQHPDNTGNSGENAPPNPPAEANSNANPPPDPPNQPDNPGNGGGNSPDHPPSDQGGGNGQGNPPGNSPGNPPADPPGRN